MCKSKKKATKASTASSSPAKKSKKASAKKASPSSTAAKKCPLMTQESDSVGTNTATWTLADGLPVSVEAELSELAGDDRGGSELYAQTKTRKRGLDDDDAGHIIGHRFMGDQGMKNLFPQNFRCNRGAYKTMENEWAAWIDKGCTVIAKVTLVGGTPERPDQIDVAYDVYNKNDDLIHSATDQLPNDETAKFKRVKRKDIAKLAK